MIRLQDVRWTYPHAEAPSLVDLDLSIRPGECVVLCGASGSGKSTALRAINGLIPHFHEEGVLSGQVTVDGRDTRASTLDELGLGIGTVLQHPRRQFFTDRAAAEVAFAMENFGFEPAQIRARRDELLAELSETVPIGQRLRDLSGGQQQQVAIAAATAHGPAILLLDEPSSNLSRDAVERLAERLRALKEAGTTIVVAEHRLRYLDGVADRFVVMSQGRIAAEWSAEELRALPDDVLAEEGLRGAPRDSTLPLASASGRLVADALAPVGGMSAGLQLEGVRCTLGGRRVVEVQRAWLPAGTVTAFRGVNGAGKSTLARILVGLQRASGTVTLDGIALSRSRRQRASAIVMQDVQRQLFTESVSEEVKLAAPRGLAADAHEGLLSALDLDELSERHPLSLSGGQQQRLVVATARLSERRIVVFDEPSSGVDRRHLDSIAEQIRAVACDGSVVILISHDEDLLLLAADQELTLVPPEPENGAGATRERPEGFPRRAKPRLRLRR